MIIPDFLKVCELYLCIELLTYENEMGNSTVFILYDLLKHKTDRAIRKNSKNVFKREVWIGIEVFLKITLKI